MVNVNTFSTTSIICLEMEITVKDEILEGGRDRQSEVERAPHYSNNFVHCGVGVEVICHSTFQNRYRF